MQRFDLFKALSTLKWPFNLYKLNKFIEVEKLQFKEFKCNFKLHYCLIRNESKYKIYLIKTAQIFPNITVPQFHVVLSLNYKAFIYFGAMFQFQ